MTSVLVGGVKPLLFFEAMVAGMAAYELLERRDKRLAGRTAPP